MLVQSCENYEAGKCKDDCVCKQLHVCHAARETSRQIASAGTKLKMEDKIEDGVAQYKEAIAVCPSYGATYYNLGVVHSEAKEVSSDLQNETLSQHPSPRCAKRHSEVTAGASDFR